jgi:hypothetical protein
MQWSDAIGKRHDRCTLIDGEMVSWYGSRAIRGLAYLRHLRASLAAPG